MYFELLLFLVKKKKLFDYHLIIIIIVRLISLGFEPIRRVVCNQRY